MKSIDALVKKAMDYKKKGLKEDEIADELHLSKDTIIWLLTRGLKGGEPPKDVKIGWRSIGVMGNRIAAMASSMTDIILEETEKSGNEPQCVAGIAINGIPYATCISEELGSELAIYRPPSERGKAGGHFSSNYASIQNKKVIFVDDVVSTGETMKGAMEDARVSGGTPILAIVLVNKTGQDELNGIPLRALIRARSI
jgi:orotate phosphoribosyltransferase